MDGGTTTVPVRHQGELLGALTLTKPPNETLTPTERKLVADLAAQAGLVLRNVRLIEDLRASRQRLVAAQDEERVRLERNLHDGAQQQLVALAVKQRLVESVLERDPPKARALMAELQAQTAEALETLRDLARGIYPPILADKGLEAALEAQIRRAAVPIELEADVPNRYPREIEAAVYFSCLEALQNVAKYANASRTVVRLNDAPGWLTFTVADDGVGFDAARTTFGTGIMGIRDRVEALGGELTIEPEPGGGIRLSGSLPLRR
jgi:signal transduction histidine kinase